MADEFQIIPYRVRSAGTDVPPEEVQAGLNSLAFQTQVALNSLAGGGGTIPAGNVTFTQAGAGATTRTLQSKEQEIVSAADFAGFDPTGVSDSTTAIQNALNSFGATGGAVLIPHGSKALVNNNLNVPDKCLILGAGATVLGDTSNPATILNTATQLILNTSATISLNNSSGIKNIPILAKNITFNETSAQVAANFLGRAVTLVDGTSDHLVEDCLILGFNTAIGTTVSTARIDRPRIHRVVIDCINGVYLRNIFDVPYLSEIHGVPFVTFQSAAEGNNAQLKRSGAFIQLDSVADYAKLTNCFSFGWMTGFATSGGGGGAITWLSCGADHPVGTSDGSVGWNIAGSVYDSRLIGCQTSAKDTGIIVNTTDSTNGRIYIDTTNVWSVNVTGMVVTAGTVRASNSEFRNTGGVGTGISAAAGTITALDQCDVLGFSTGISTTAITTVVRHRFCDFTGTTTSLNNPYQPSVASASPLVLNGIDTAFTVTGTTGFSTVNSAATYAGKQVTLEFAGSLTVSTGGNITDLAGNFVTAAGYTLTLYSDGASWYEVSRSANGNLTASNIAISGAAGTTRAEQFQTAGSNRFQIRVSNEAESGGNAGSNFNLDRYSDAGGFLDSPINVNRASGNVTTSQGLTVTGSFAPSQTNGIIGTTTNNNANAGSVGETITSTVLAGSAVALSTGVTANITSISLTAGDWDVWGNVWTIPAGSTIQTLLTAATSTTSATVPTAPNNGGSTQLPYTAATGAAIGAPVGNMRLSLSTTTTVFLVVNVNFSASTNAAYGFIGARRRR